MFKKAMEKKILLMHPFVGTRYYEINWLFIHLSPERESFTNETYHLLKLLVSSEKYQQESFLNDFNNFKEQLFDSGKMTPNSWTLSEILKIYLQKVGIM